MTSDEYVSAQLSKARVNLCHGAVSVVRPSVRQLFTCSTSFQERIKES